MTCTNTKRLNFIHILYNEFRTIDKVDKPTYSYAEEIDYAIPGASHKYHDVVYRRMYG